MILRSEILVIAPLYFENAFWRSKFLFNSRRDQCIAMTSACLCLTHAVKSQTADLQLYVFLCYFDPSNQSKH